MSINNITMVGNSADYGGNLAINFTDFTSNYHYGAEVPSVVVNNNRIIAGTGHSGGGLRVWSVIVTGTEEKISYKQMVGGRCILQVSNTQFVENHAYSGGGALFISHYQTEQTDSQDIFSFRIALSMVTLSHHLDTVQLWRLLGSRL